MPSQLFALNKADFLKGAVVAVISGFILPILLILQSPDFQLNAVVWHQLLVIGMNGAVSGFAAYITKNLFTDENGKVFGKIG